MFEPIVTPAEAMDRMIQENLPTLNAWFTQLNTEAIKSGGCSLFYIDTRKATAALCQCFVKSVGERGWTARYDSTDQTISVKATIVPTLPSVFSVPVPVETQKVDF